MRIGDRLRVGAILLEVTAPRIPCVTLAARMEDPRFVKTFRHAERPGAYCRVIEPGHVAVNDPVEVLPYSGPAVGVVEMFRWFYKKQLSAEELRRLPAVPIPEKDRAHYEELLARVLSAHRAGAR